MYLFKHLIGVHIIIITALHKYKCFQTTILQFTIEILEVRANKLRKDTFFLRNLDRYSFEIDTFQHISSTLFCFFEIKVKPSKNVQYSHLT